MTSPFRVEKVELPNVRTNEALDLSKTTLRQIDADGRLTICLFEVIPFPNYCLLSTPSPFIVDGFTALNMPVNQGTTIIHFHRKSR